MSNVKTQIYLPAIAKAQAFAGGHVKCKILKSFEF